MIDGPTGDAARVPLVLVPGLLCDERLWRYQVGSLRDFAEPVVVADVTRGSSVSEMARAVLEASSPRDDSPWPASRWAATSPWR